MITFVKRYRIRSPPAPSLFPTTTEAGEGAQNFARPMFRGGKCPFGRDWRLLDVFGNHLRRKGKKSVICKRRRSRGSSRRRAIGLPHRGQSLAEPAHDQVRGTLGHELLQEHGGV